jgi:hypothetical protein
VPINSADEQFATLQVMDAMTDLGVFISEAKRKLEEQAALFKRMDVRLSLCLGRILSPACKSVLLGETANILLHMSSACTDLYNTACACSEASAV